MKFLVVTPLSIYQFRNFNQPSNLNHATPEIMASIPLAVVTAAAEEVGFSISKDAVEDMGEDVNEVEENTYKEVVEESVLHMKVGFTSKMSSITLKMQSSPHYQTRKEKG